MTQTEISNFLQAGAFFGGADGQCLLFEGPRARSEASSEAPSGSFNVALQPFFESRAVPYLAGSKPRFVSRNQLKTVLEDFLRTNSGSVPGAAALMKASDWDKPLMADYEKAFSDIQQRIRGGALKKAVPVVFARKNFRPGESLSQAQKAAWILKLLELPSQRLYLYGFWNGTDGILGATPEVLFHKKGLSVTTMALAGTLPKSEVAHRLQLSEDPKETHEHRLVVEDIVSQLGRFGSVQTGSLETIELPTLFHLKTQIELQLNAAKPLLHVLELLNVLHPTPALGVSPRTAGYQWMAEHPGQSDRGIFGGPILFQLSPDEAIALVAIRNVEWNALGLKIGSGGGVVAESELQREWTELQQKREAVFKSLGM